MRSNNSGSPNLCEKCIAPFLKLLFPVLALLLSSFGAIPVLSQAQPKNIIFILSDDHRYDYMGFHPESPDFLETPSMDRMADEGVHLSNAFVTTSLCSPSRASILTGQYSFRHGAVDNYNPMKEGVRFFPEQLQEEGYETAFMGKWHIGEAHDDPKPGFDRWISFKGQGVYYDPELNIDGERVQQEGYITDILTNYAIDWLDDGRNKRKPFFLYLSHKAVHSQFHPAERHQGKYADADLPEPQSGKKIAENYEGKPRWVEEQRYSWHGVDHAYHGKKNLEQIIRNYSESLLAVDESVGKVLDYLEKEGLAEETLVIYMGDNGFMFGEHGLIDKRNAYEESMRVPMLAWGPGYLPEGETMDEVVLNIDVASTFLDLAGAEMPKNHVVDGRSFLPMLEGESLPDWRDNFIYQYFWEDAFPHTPTTYAIRSAKFKYIYYHGVWDKKELYNLQSDPGEMHNLIAIPHYRSEAEKMHKMLFDKLSEYGATDVKFRRPGSYRLDERKIHERSH